MLLVYFSISSYVDNIILSLKSLPSTCDIIVLGDFNLPDVNWFSYTGTSPVSTSLCNCITTLNFIQFVTEPTHKQGNILDLILSNSPMCISGITTDKSDWSDHFLVLCEIDPGSTRSANTSLKDRILFKYTSENLIYLCDYLLEANFDVFFSHVNSDQLWLTLKNTIQDARDCVIPAISCKPSKLPKWFDPPTKHLLNRVRSLRRSTKRRPSIVKLLNLLFVESVLQKSILLAKEAYISIHLSTLNQGIYTNTIVQT